MKLNTLIPSLKQYANWSMPSKHGFIGLIIGIVSLLLTISIFFYSYERSDKSIINEIESYNTQRDWSSLSIILEQIKGKESLQDIYNLMYGRVSISNPTLSVSGPEKYLLTIPKNSIYFDRSIQSLFYYYVTTNRDNISLEKKLNSLALHVGNDKPYYYFIKYIIFATTNNASYQTLKSEYDKMINYYSKLIDFSQYPFVVYSGTGGVANVKWALEIQALVFVYNGLLAIKAYNSQLTEKINIHYNNFMTMRRGNGVFINNRETNIFEKNSTKLVLSNTVSQFDLIIKDFGYKDLVKDMVKTIDKHIKM
jgi:hypothetical protein